MASNLSDCLFSSKGLLGLCFASQFISSFSVFEGFLPLGEEKLHTFAGVSFILLNT